MSDGIDVAPKVGETFEQASNGFLGMMAVEVIGAKVGVLHTIPEHVVSGGEHGSSHREDGFLGAAPGLDAEELGAQIASCRAPRPKRR